MCLNLAKCKKEDPVFSDVELLRYGRHIALPEFGIKGQEKLKKSSVLVVGAGGLGCPLLLYLAAAGVGAIGIIDDDVVDLSNLQRQVLFTVDDLGQPKATCAAKRLFQINPEIKITPIIKRLDANNALEILARYDVVADGTDNFPSRYLINDACVLLQKTNVHASIFRFEGQVAVFNHLHADGSRGPNYRDVFPAPPPEGLVPDCATAGVLGVLPGIIGSIQASEVIKVLSGIGESLAGRLLIFDALHMETRSMKIRKNPALAPITELIDYEFFCHSQDASKIEGDAANPHIISPQVLHLLIGNISKSIQLIDVRESHEYAQGNLGGMSIPLYQLVDNIHKIPRDIPVVCICRSGMRSQKAMELLKKKGFMNVKICGED
ncbi:MAG: molybdopterin-synthase adenylyltransferase MoeB [Cyclobacteriaceae bacterium]|nr:molybdopterin-synthase adenylyltransferase MoeB [Cyclobacteriaceae bacterium]